MLQNINSLLNSSTTKVTDNKGSGALTGKIAELSSEIKLINSIQPIKVTAVQTTQTQQGPTQFIRVSNDKSQTFTVVNENPSSNIKTGDSGNLDASKGATPTLTINKQTSNATISVQPSNYGSNQNSAQAFSQGQNQVTTHASNSSQQATSSSHVSGTASKSATLDSTALNQTTGNKEVLTNIKIVSDVLTLKVVTNSTPIPTAQSSSAGNTNATTALPNGVASSATQSSQQTSPQSFQTVVTDGRQEFTLTTKTPLKEGASLQVFVDNQGKVQLAPTQQTTTQSTPQTEALKQSLPNQLTFQEFSNTLKQLQSLAASGEALPPKVQSALNQLVKEFPNLTNLINNPDALKSAIRNSGIFAESNLAKSNENVPQDLKLNLIRLQNAQQDADSALVKQQQVSLSMNSIAGAIDRISTNQLRHVVEQSQADNSIYPLHIELPVKNGSEQSVVKLKIDQDRDSNDLEPHKRRWLVQLKFDFEETGKFEARVSVQERKVSALFAVESQTTERIIKTQFPVLKQSLQSKDIQIDRLDSFIAKFKEEDKPVLTTERLIDVRT